MAAPLPPPPAGANADPSAAAGPPSDRRAQEVRAQVDAVRSVMAANVAAVLDRGERLETLEEKTDVLGGQAAAFQRQGASLRRKMWWGNARAKLFAGLAVALVLAVLFSLACFTGGRNCLGGGGRNAAAPTPVDGPGGPLLGVGGSGVLGVGGGVGGGGVGGGVGGGGGDGVTVLPDGTLSVPTPNPLFAPPAPPSAPDPGDAPGVLTGEELAMAMAGAGRRRRSRLLRF